MNKLKKLTIALVLINHINAPSPTTITAHDQLALIPTQIADRYTSSDKRRAVIAHARSVCAAAIAKLESENPAQAAAQKAAFDAKCQEFTASSGVVLSSHALGV